MAPERDRESFFAALAGDGVPLLLACAGALVFAGGLALFLAASRELLPHDVRHLGMTAAELCRVADCRVVDFMVHDRAAFGGALVGVGTMYAWLALFPLRRGERWAWWAFALTGVAGFGSFLAYLGYGYLDSWHAAGTLLLLPVYAAGLARSRAALGAVGGPAALLRPGSGLLTDRSPAGLGRLVLVAGAAGTVAGGASILYVGVTGVFVPEDLAFMRVTEADLRAVDPGLVPLIAHDRAGFGGTVLVLGLVTLAALWCARPSRSLWQAVAVAGGASLAAALGVHGAVGYTDPWHLLPAVVAAGSLVLGLALSLARGPETAGPGGATDAPPGPGTI